MASKTRGNFAQICMFNLNSNSVCFFWYEVSFFRKFRQSVQKNLIMVQTSWSSLEHEDMVW